MKILAMTCLCLLLTSGGNLLLKRGMSMTGGFEVGGQALAAVTRIATNPWVLLGMACYVASMVLWLQLLSMAELSYLYPIFVGGAFLIVTIISAVVFHEHVTLPRVLGLVLVSGGIAVASLAK